MAGLKEIKRRVKSVKNTKKITYAMKLVSAAKLRKAQEAVTRSRDYTNALSKLLQDLGGEQGLGDARHPLMDVRAEVKNIRILVIGGSRGLCGGYNSNVQKKIEELTAQQRKAHPAAKISSVLMGKRPADYYRRKKYEIFKSYEDLVDDPNRWPLEEVCRGLEQAFIAGEVDEVYVISTRFKSAISVFPTAERILPMASNVAEVSKPASGEVTGTTLFEPSAAEVFSAIIPRIMRAKVRQAALDAKASEHGSRMTAMDSATTNATDLIHSLTLKQNKLRQSGITAELLDIIGGSEGQN